MASLRVALCVALLAPAAALQLPARSPLRRSAVARRAAPSPAPPPAAASAAAGLKRRVAGLGRAAATGRFGRAGAAGPLAASVSISDESKAGRVIPLLSFIGLWYAFNAFFNVDRSLVLKFLPIAALHCGGHGLQVSSMGAGSVFFTHVIKATEPVIGTLVLLAFTGKIAPCDLVGYASLAALGSTVAFSIAKLLAKSLMGKETKQKYNLTAPNNYAFLTICSTTLLLLPSALGEGGAALAAFQQMPDQLAFARQLVARFLYYGYNEMGFRVLDLLSPVSAAVANSLKRVSSAKIIGSSVAMGGVLLYSLAKTKASKLPPKPVEIEVAVEKPGTWQPKGTPRSLALRLGARLCKPRTTVQTT
ncbi:hypothetical protein JL721_2097 [Aureococcus anophagefferens]|nr:hypothetical protein JL721_2097 [Aureococcus anophagefferens]